MGKSQLKAILGGFFIELFEKIYRGKLHEIFGILSKIIKR